MHNETYRVQTAIEDSIREGITAELEARLDSQDWVNLANALDRESDDYSEERDKDGNVVREYRGRDRDGDEFRVRLIGRA